jgi:hypothetical protein
MNNSLAADILGDPRETLSSLGNGIEIARHTIYDAFIFPECIRQRLRVATVDMGVFKDCRPAARAS